MELGPFSCCDSTNRLRGWDKNKWLLPRRMAWIASFLDVKSFKHPLERVPIIDSKMVNVY